MQDLTRPDATDVLGRLGSIVRVRWLGVAFATVQVLAYTQPYPDRLREVALVLVVVMALSNVAFELALRRVTVERAPAFAVVVVALDVLTLSGITWVYAFDSLSAIFAVLFLLPIEAAVLFGLPGAMWTWGAVAVLYAGREWFGTRYGNPFEPESLTFRVGLIGLVALIVGLLVRDLVGQRRATGAALREVERSEASLTALIRVLAHDLRAPIAGARTAIDTLEAGGDRLTGDERTRVLAAGRRQADRALLLARDLLDLARAEAGTLTVEPRDVALEQAFAQLVVALGPSAPEVVDAGGCHALVDPVRLEQVLFNLLDNAAKYGLAPVEVTAVQDGAWVEVRVRDHGPGIPEGVELFTPFSRAGEGSVGLGMWIVRQLVEVMGGTVRHEAAEPGARFVLRFPAA